MYKGNWTSVTCMVIEFFNCMMTGSFSIGLAPCSACQYSPNELLAALCPFFWNAVS